MRNIGSTLLLACSLLLALPASAQDSVRADAACTSGPPALRQSLVIIDEHLIQKGDNSRWIRPVLEFADALGLEQRGTMAPRERLTVLVARRSGTDLATIFTGCSPNIAEADRRKLESESGSLTTFFTGSVTQRLQKDRESFERNLTTAFQIAVRWQAEGAVRGEPGAFLQSLASSPKLVDLARGIPRILIVSPLDLLPASPSSPKAARLAGFEQAAQLGLDLHRAEVYVAALGAAPQPHIRPYLEALLLRARGFVVGWRQDGLPPISDAPASVSVYSGTVQWSDITAPVQIRLAADAQGNLVNSWVEISAGRSLASPVTGKLICRAERQCEATGDGRNLGQSWNPEPGERPTFDRSFAWTGLRYFALSEQRDQIVARVWDPEARVKINDTVLDEFRFPLQRTPAIQF